MRNTRIGIIGGGQLGMLLLKTAVAFPCTVSVYDPSAHCPAAHFTHDFAQGGFYDYDAIVEFGSRCDVVIFETESANSDALLELEKKGVRVVSSPQSLVWIKNKEIQRKKLQEHGFPVQAFKKLSPDELENYDGPLPIVQKFCTGGYDGQGVVIHKDRSTLTKHADVDSIWEELVDIDKELSVMVARNESGEIALYPTTEMVFDETLNLVDYLIAPARISTEQEEKLMTLTKDLAEKLEFIGVYGIEYFLTKKGDILINEISPRVHNSGHQSIPANAASQYEQQIRIALQLPLGSTQMISPSILLNLIGEGGPGPTHYQGLEKAYEIPNVQYVFYGKEEVRPGRKMGHAVIICSDIEEGLKKVDLIKDTLTITTHE